MDESKRLCAFLLESAVSEMPQGCETILGIFDLKGFSSQNADLGFVRFLVGLPYLQKFAAPYLCYHLLFQLPAQYMWILWVCVGPSKNKCVLGFASMSASSIGTSRRTSIEMFWIVARCLLPVYSVQQTYTEGVHVMHAEVDAFFLYYPKRLGQVLFVDAPWAFKPGWEMVKPWLKKYAALVRFVSREELQNEFFTPETCPEDFLR